MSKIYILSKKPEDWQSLLADPVKPWRRGYSARTLTYCRQEGEGFPISIIKAFEKSDIDLFQNIEMLLAIPKHQVSLPGGSRSGRGRM
ncbi:MAG: hypothetical protein P8012_16495 [Desulfobacterales bacterium]